MKSVGESSSRPLDYYATNVGATVNLLKIAGEYGCYRFVYSSSATVYGIPPKIPIPETTPLVAESVYGRTKVFCEHVLMDLAASAPEKWRLISLRYFKYVFHPARRRCLDRLLAPQAHTHRDASARILAGGRATCCPSWRTWPSAACPRARRCACSAMA